MKRVAVFAHYDKDNVVDDYVIYYLKALKNIASDIIFVSCQNILNKNALDGLVTHIIEEQHNEYDFGSYKRGYLYLKESLNNYDELIFANDSCFGPFYPFQKIFDKMSGEKCDFWGITKNNFGTPKGQNPIKREHIQSYFIVFNKKVFTSNVFCDFINSIKEEKSKKDIIFNYEIKLTEILIKSGYLCSAFINAYPNIDNITILRWHQIISKYNMPFMKTSLIKRKNLKIATIDGFDDLISNISDYPLSLIFNYMGRMNIEYKKSSKFIITLKRFAFTVATSVPPIIRRIVVMLFGCVLKYLKD